ncbi:hypothetical protein IF1G_03265 [Cordyceps javanica]|uniref:Uncharacterized protein n=1 Tax=Cordyceps javanica TaxID=43265 RepID=A0A545V729_9HYPO|nr:hypothetical protein IF1G_03265 [Cordyceps javanica]
MAWGRTGGRAGACQPGGTSLGTYLARYLLCGPWVPRSGPAWPCLVLPVPGGT